MDKYEEIFTLKEEDLFNIQEQEEDFLNDSIVVNNEDELFKKNYLNNYLDDTEYFFNLGINDFLLYPDGINDFLDDLDESVLNKLQQLELELSD